MNRRAIALRLSVLVALSGLLPIAGIGLFSIEVLSRRLEHGSQEALRVVAQQAAERIHSYLDQQQILVRTLAAALARTPDMAARLEAVKLDAHSVKRLELVTPTTPLEMAGRLTAAQLQKIRGGASQLENSPWYQDKDQTPAMDICLPMPGQPGAAVCATLDLLDLWLLVQHIKVGESGYALAFDAKGRLLAAGAGSMRGDVLRGGEVAESPFAIAAARSPELAPTRYKGGTGEEVLAGWAVLSPPGWSVVVEQPTREALRGARAAQLWLALAGVAALLISIGVGIVTSVPILTELEVDERWRTAGRIATGITHDMGHRLAVLQQTAALAETADPAFLPLIRANLRNEVATLKKFVGDFADLSREVRTSDLLPLELNAFLESLRRTASPHAEKLGVLLEVRGSEGSTWVRADRYLLERAALNLAYNAIEASPAGGMVRLSCVVRAGPRGEVVAAIDVHDQGAGISADRLPRIFDAFRSTKRTGAHVGMGLPNVHRIVTAHGGSVTVESEVGKGSTFTIALPVTTPDEETTPMGLEPKKA